jgi:hypothetical protein
MFDPTAFSPGDRVRLLWCSDSLTALRPGATGTVRRVDDAGTVHIAWDDGRHLGLNPDSDGLELIESPPDPSG